MKIVVIGSSNTDMIINVPRIPAPGETILGGKFAMAGGGKGANQAVAAVRAGGEVAFVARIGDDLFGERALAGFHACGIDTEFVQIDAQMPSGVAEIFVAESGENSIAVAPGANANLSPADVHKAAGIIAAAQVIVLQLESPLETVQAAVDLAYQNGVKVILNPAPARELPDDLLRKITLLTPNESEAGTLCNLVVQDDKSAAQAATMLKNKGVAQVIITCGAAGCAVATQEFCGFVPAFAVDVVDTTAAGDVFNGALAVALTEDRILVEAIKFAGAAAAISVTRNGAQPSAPSRDEIETFLKNNIT